MELYQQEQGTGQGGARRTGRKEGRRVLTQGWEPGGTKQLRAGEITGCPYLLGDKAHLGAWEKLGRARESYCLLGLWTEG